MRALFLFLLAANLAFFAWSRYASTHAAGSDPAPLARQIDPDKLKVVPPPGARAAAAGRGAAGACLEWGSFTTAEAALAGQALEPLALGPRLSQRRSEETAHWWVYLPSQGGRQRAQRKLEELKSLGVEEYFVLQEEGALRWAVSLGVFRTQEAAKARLGELESKKVRGARVGERDTQVTRVAFQLRGADEALRSKLGELAKGFAGSELHDCPAAN